MKLLKVLASLSPRVEMQLIRNLTLDLRAPSRSHRFQLLIEAHKRRRAQECRKVRPAKYPRPQISETLSSRGGRLWRAPVGIPAPTVQGALAPSRLERLLTAPSMSLRQAD